MWIYRYCSRTGTQAVPSTCSVPRSALAQMKLIPHTISLDLTTTFFVTCLCNWTYFWTLNMVAKRSSETSVTDRKAAICHTAILTVLPFISLVNKMDVYREASPPKFCKSCLSIPLQSCARRLWAPVLHCPIDSGWPVQILKFLVSPSKEINLIFFKYVLMFGAITC